MLLKTSHLRRRELVPHDAVRWDDEGLWYIPMEFTRVR